MKQNDLAHFCATMGAFSVPPAASTADSTVQMRALREELQAARDSSAEQSRRVEAIQRDLHAIRCVLEPVLGRYLQAAVSTQSEGIAAIRSDFDTIRHAADSIQMDHVLGADGRYSDPLHLCRANLSVYSQVGEDGIISEIFSRIGCRDRTFVEIGVGDGSENTTRLLVESGWRGVWIEASEASAEAARHLMRDAVGEHRLTIMHALATAENVDDLLDSAGVQNSFDYLSIDVDQNTHHVWRSLRRHARAACIEYNANLPPSSSSAVPYEADAAWDGTNWYGASVGTLETIGLEKSMSLVGCDLMGVNAFFVASNEASGRFAAPFSARHHFEPPRYHAPPKAQRHPSGRPRRWDWK